MPNVASRVIDGRVVHIGDTLFLTDQGVKSDLGATKNEKFTVVYIDVREGKNGISLCTVGLQGSLRREERTDLEGRCNSHRGVIASELYLFNNFRVKQSGMKYIRTSHVFNRKDLKGMKCKVLSPIASDERSIFVEFEENIRGCCSDGLGKSGHCLLVDSNLLCDKPEEVERDKEKTKKKREKKKRGRKIKGGKLKNTNKK